MQSARSLSAFALVVLLVAPALAGLGVSGADAASAPGALPDVRIAAFHVSHGAFSPPGFPPPPPRGVTIVLENAGNATAPDTIVEFSVVRPDGLRDVLTGFESFPLAPGERATFRGQWAPPPDKVGDYDLVATADPRDVLAELDEFNNAAHARTGNAPAIGVVYPARTVGGDTPDTVLALDPWARFALDKHDAWNPAPWLLLDRSGNARDAWLPEGAPRDAAGRIDRARLFTGGTYASAPLPDGAQKSVTFWMKPVSATATGVLVASDAPSCERAALTLDAGRFTWHAPAPEPACASRALVSAPAPLGAWSHVAVVTTGVATTVFVDGALAHRVLHADARSGLDAPSARALVGAAIPGADGVPSTRLTDVVLDDVLVFDRALSPAEVAVLADVGRSPNA